MAKKSSGPFFSGHGVYCQKLDLEKPTNEFWKKLAYHEMCQVLTTGHVVSTTNVLKHLNTITAKNRKSDFRHRR